MSYCGFRCSTEMIWHYWFSEVSRLCHKMVNDLVPGRGCPGAIEFGFQEVSKQAVGFQGVSHGAPVVFRSFQRMTDQIELPDDGSWEGRNTSMPGFQEFPGK